MLGVVRVFSRKSTIILADTNSVLHAVKRYSTQSSTQLSGKKRSRVTTHLAEGHEAGINLQEGNDKARFDLITLPARKKVKAARKGPHKKQGAALSRSAGSYSCDIRGNGSLLLSDPSFGDSVEIDVLTAMQNVFPTVAVPRLGDHLPSGLSSPTSVHNLGNQRKMLYSARDQDITLSQPMRGLDQLAFDVFEEDLRGSIRSDPMSNVGDSRPLWMTGMQGNGDQVQQNDALSLAPSRSQASGGNATISPFDISHGEVNLEPMEIEPLGIPSTNQAPGISAKKKSRESCKLISLAVSSPSRTASDFKTPTRQVQTNKEFSHPQATNSSRKRRSAILRLDHTTEMSPSEVRNCLNDTNDILLTGFDERRREKRRAQKGSREHVTFEVPGILASFSNNITDLWKSMTVPPFVVMGGKEQTRAQPSTHGRNPPTARSRTENVLKTQNDPEPVEFALQDEQAMVPVMDVGRIVPGGRNSSSADVDRANSDPSKAPSADLLSFPSSSAQGGSHSKHGTTGTGHGSSDHYRDFLDIVSVADVNYHEQDSRFKHDGRINEAFVFDTSLCACVILKLRLQPLIIKLLTSLGREIEKFEEVSALQHLLRIPCVPDRKNSCVTNYTVSTHHW